MKPNSKEFLSFIFTFICLLNTSNAETPAADNYDFGGSRQSKLDDEGGNLNTLLARLSVNKSCRSAVDKAHKSANGPSLTGTKSAPEGENFGRMFISQKPFTTISSRIKVDEKTGEVVVTTTKRKFSGKSSDDSSNIGEPSIKKLKASDFSQEELKCLKSPEMDQMKGCSWEGNAPKPEAGKCSGKVKCQPSFAGAGSDPLNMHVNSVSCFAKVGNGGCVTGADLDTCVRDGLRPDSDTQFSRNPILGIEALRRRTGGIENTVR